MYESRKNMGDVHKDVSSSIEKRKDVLSEEHEHNRDSEQRQDETEFHLSDAVGLDLEDYVVAVCIPKSEEALKGVTK